MAAPGDDKVSRLVDQYLAKPTAGVGELDPDAVLAELEAEDDSAFRAARAQQLASEISRLKPSNAPAQSTGEVFVTLRSDDEVLRFTTESPRCLLHFLHPDFGRCGTMDTHLQRLAERHARYGSDEVKFGRVNVQDASFVVEKLGVRVLPCVVGFIGGIAKGRIIGFEGVSWGGKESGLDVTKEIENTAVGWSVLSRRLLVEVEADAGSDSEEDSKRFQRKGIQDRKQKTEDQDDDWD